MQDRNAQHPDIAEIFAGKALARRKRAQLSFAEKLDILDALRERVAPIVQARAARARRKTRHSLARV
jgi:hypothetical protein